MRNTEIEYVENLLKNYKSMSARRLNLNRKLSLIQKQKDNAIEGQFLKAKALTDMPGIPRDGLKEEKVLLPDDREYNDLKNEEGFVVQELDDLWTIIEAINESLNSLTHREKEIVYLFYVERLGWQKICTIVNYSDRQCQRVKDQAIEYLYKSLEPLKNVVNMSVFNLRKVI